MTLRAKSICILPHLGSTFILVWEGGVLIDKSGLSLTRKINPNPRACRRVVSQLHNSMPKAGKEKHKGDRVDKDGKKDGASKKGDRDASKEKNETAFSLLANENAVDPTLSSLFAAKVHRLALAV